MFERIKNFVSAILVNTMRTRTMVTKRATLALTPTLALAPSQLQSRKTLSLVNATAVPQDVEVFYLHLNRVV